MVKTAYVFPGQGAQYPGMGKDLWEHFSCVKELFSEASEVCSRDFKKLLFDSDEQELKQTVNTQTAITLVSASVREVLSQMDLHSSCSAGFSLGEMSALYDAGGISFEQLMHLTQRRAEIMDRCSREYEQVKGGPAMAAVIGLSFTEVRDIISSSGIEQVYAANENGLRQVTVSGLSEGINAVKPLLMDRGARRVIPLRVSGPFHTPLMAEAAEDFARELQQVAWKPLTKPCFSNVTGDVISSSEEAAELCARQIVQPVRWVSIMKGITALGADSLLEVGPGKVLSGLWNSFSKEVPCRTVSTVTQVESLTASALLGSV